MRRIVSTVILFLPLFFVYGFQWPVDDVIIVSTFGESEFDQFVKGVDIGGKSQDVMSSSIFISEIPSIPAALVVDIKPVSRAFFTSLWKRLYSA